MDFDEVAVYFSKEEWERLTEEQKVLYNEVMMENYQTLRSLGRIYVKPLIIAKLERGKDPYVLGRRKIKHKKIHLNANKFKHSVPDFQTCARTSTGKVRERAERYTLEEKDMLIREVLAREDLLWSKTTPTPDRTKAWREITAAVCRVGRFRTVLSVKHRFHDCRSEVRKKMEQAAVGKEVKFAHWEEQMRNHLARTLVVEPGVHSSAQQSEESQHHQEEETQEKEQPQVLPSPVEGNNDNVLLAMSAPPQQEQPIQLPSPPLQEPRMEVPLPPVLPPDPLQHLPPLFPLPPVPPPVTPEIPQHLEIIRQLKLFQEEKKRKIRWQMRIYAQQERYSYQMATIINLLQQLVKRVARSPTPDLSRPSSSSSSVASQYIKRRIKREASRTMHKKYKNHKNF
ncbi:myb-related transcription factor, partner of profilin [Bombina bombina]|uniref:myb-related transcription factor, partner of profilin n=1 Tax=Bombina bombina TaxID=8345 RepID=UPI00235AE983|nr:myb-related transcription factor, partner of profilin [Bombina bombina]